MKWEKQLNELPPDELIVVVKTEEESGSQYDGKVFRFKTSWFRTGDDIHVHYVSSPVI